MQQYRLGSDWLVSNIAEKEVGVLVDNKLSMRHLMCPYSNEGHLLLDYIKMTAATGLRKVIFPLYSSIMGPHLEYCVPFLPSSIRKILIYLNASSGGLPRWSEGWDI